VQDIQLSDIANIIWAIGDNPTREGLKDTPARVIRSWKEIYSGYTQQADEVLSTTFSRNRSSGPITLENINFVSMCEHHMLPFYGTVSITYNPTDRILGISKLVRLVEVYARRLQIQERLTYQIADALYNCDAVQSCTVEIRATHLCMIMRGVCQDNAVMVTREER